MRTHKKILWSGCIQLGFCVLWHLGLASSLQHLLLSIYQILGKLVRAECVRQRNEVAIKIIASYTRAPRHITALLLPYNRAPHAIKPCCSCHITVLLMPNNRIPHGI